MNATESTPNVRVGTVHVKASKTDPIYQTFSVRESDGFAEYYHRQLSRWVSLPAEWLARVVWSVD